MHKRVLKIFIILLALGFVLFVLINVFITLSSFRSIFTEASELTQHKAALVLGARVYTNGTMSPMFLDRAQTALELYQVGKVKKILVSGDHGRPDYDEVNTAKDFLLEKGVAPGDIFLDHAGFDTYDSLYRAREIFGVSSLVIVTQKFHLPRAIYIAHALGLDAVGFSADKQKYVGMTRNRIRESLARIKAFWNITSNSSPKFLGEKIPISGDSKLSWD